jgi:hypothetical protein
MLLFYVSNIVKMMKLIAICFMIKIGLAFVKSTPLDDYVNAPDPHYGYEIIQTYNMTGYTVYILNFTSQIWLDGKFQEKI